MKLTVPQLQVLAQDLEQWERSKEIALSPIEFIKYVKAFDAETGEQFIFGMDKGSPWEWQRELIEWWQDNTKTIILKARQLGITWLAAAYALWHLLYKPYARILIYSITEVDAIKVIKRIWGLFLSLPPWLTKDIRVIKPAKNARATTEIEIEINGKVASIIAFPSSKAAGHGETATLAILDEFSRHENARECWKAVLPTASKGGRVLVISTANGISNDITGEGNYFHHLWDNADFYNIEKRFLRWDLHPDRDENWYQNEAMALPTIDRGEQYPRNPTEAFILTGERFFDEEAINFYRDGGLLEPDLCGKFVIHGDGKANFRKDEKGVIKIFKHPDPDSRYIIAADVATGRGLDYSAAVVLDLESLTIMAEIHGKMIITNYTEQLHCLGRYYNDATIAVESAGGYGEAVNTFLKDGKDGRPPYPKVYLHVKQAHLNRPQAKIYGFPMNSEKDRGNALSSLQNFLYEQEFPFLYSELLKEIDTFVHKNTSPSPRAQDGCNDDRVMALAIACSIYRKRGLKANRKLGRATPKALYPWIET